MSYNRKQLVKVELSVYKPFHGCPGRYTDYLVAVVGPGLQLGNEDPDIAVRCNPVGHHFWTKTFWLPKEKDVYFKFLLVRASTNAIVDIEEIIPHRLHVGQKPLRVEIMYNKTATLVEEAGDDFKAPHKGKYELFYIPSLNIVRSDRIQFKAPRLECPLKSAHSVKIEQERVSQVTVLDNSTETNLPSGQKLHDLNQSCTRPEMLPTEEINPVSQYEMTIQTDGTVSHVEKKGYMTNILTQLPMTSTKQTVTQKEENVTNLSTRPTNCNTSEAIEKVEKVTNQLTQPPVNSTTQETIQNELKLTKLMPQPTICSTSEAIEKVEKMTNQLTQPPVNSTTQETIQNELKLTKIMPQPTICSSSEAVEKVEKVTNQLPQPTVNSTTQETVQKELKLTNSMPQPNICHTSQEIEKVEKMTDLLKLTMSITQPTSCTSRETIQKEEKMTMSAAQNTMTSAKNAELNITTIKTATVKPQYFQQQKVPLHLNECTVNSDIPNDASPKVDGNNLGVKEDLEVKIEQPGHFPISKKGLMLVAAGVALASYLGYRAIS
ncbi:uncharacterized protein LOC123552892 [Mercenaria mercenaria]|uniref:uncharacterized protein LOC123552892 n=1 Tax=Mercenaria mercenaria TaxID=6596 RepID=UPI00234FAE01|nr:uncharacterized protein LOC123552892 [Mercenaria mercenaria]